MQTRTHTTRHKLAQCHSRMHEYLYYSMCTCLPANVYATPTVCVQEFAESGKQTSTSSEVNVGIVVAILLPCLVITAIGLYVCFQATKRRQSQPVIQPAIQRSNTPIAAAVVIPSENSIGAIPIASDTGIRQTLTADAVMTMPPASVGEMEALPVAVAVPI